MNSAAVLARAGYCFDLYINVELGRTPGLSPDFLAKVLWGAPSPVATLQHLVNLQAHFSSVKESEALPSGSPSNTLAIQLLQQ
jgi:hypothetical protein